MSFDTKVYFLIAEPLVWRPKRNPTYSCDVLRVCHHDGYLITQCLECTNTKFGDPWRGKRKDCTCRQATIKYDTPRCGGEQGVLSNGHQQSNVLSRPALMRFKGKGLVHTIKVQKDARMQYRVFRRGNYYKFDYVAELRAKSLTGKGTCPGAFEACYVNGRTSWNKNNYRTGSTLYWPGTNSGAGEDTTAYVVLQMEHLGTESTGYFIEYQICKKQRYTTHTGAIAKSRIGWVNCPKYGKY